jgi:hypothetical protein
MRSVRIAVLGLIALCLAGDVAFCQQVITITSPLPIGSEVNPTTVGLNTPVTWSIDGRADRPAVVQAHLNYNPKPVFPSGDVHTESSSPLLIKQMGLRPGNKYEIKIWIPGKMINTSTWVIVSQDPKGK